MIAIAMLTMSNVACTSSTTPARRETDERLTHARRQYEGREVWSYGPFGVTCGTYSPGIKGHGPLRIRRIDRLSNDPTHIPLGPSDTYLGAVVEVETSTPLLVSFDVSKAALVGSGLANEDAYEATRRCVSEKKVVDDWQLAMFYSLEPVHKSHPEWSKTVLEEIASARVVPGMTHAMVAWSIGFPSQPGMLADLMRAKRWTYPGPAGTRRTVDFVDDRVSRYHAPRLDL